jgi:hypothetical protein
MLMAALPKESCAKSIRRTPTDYQSLDGFLASVDGKFSLSPAISADKCGLHAELCSTNADS